MDSSSTKSKISQSHKKSNKSHKKHESNGKQLSKKQQQQQHEEEDVGGCLRSSWICKNASCRANVHKDESFCKRCSCCVCHSFDENKDPSLWLVCEPEKSDDVEFCGLSCHIECAFREKKVGHTSLGNLIELDGCFCCYSCGKVSQILGCWKKQLMAAKEARRRDVLCYRIDLSFRLLKETSRFCELHEIVGAAKTVLEKEVGPLDELAARTDKGIVSRLPVAGEVQELCTAAIKKADELSANSVRDSVPAACRFHFEDTAPTQVTFRLIELPSAIVNEVKGYKLWCFKKGEKFKDDLFVDCSRTERRMVISDLEPCTEYTFRVVSYTEAGIYGHSHATCFTKSVEILQSVGSKEKRITDSVGNDQPSDREEKSSISSKFQIAQLSKYVQLAEAQEEGLIEAFYDVDTEKICEPEEELPSSRRPHEFDLNMVSVPDLNEELTPPPDSSGGEDNGVPLNSLAEADGDDYDDAVSNGRRKTNNNCLVISDGSGDDPEFDFLMTRKRKAISISNDSENHECDSSPIDDTLEKCVKVIRWLEREGHIDKIFRVRFLTWFSLSSTAQEQSVVSTFVQTLEDDPSSLAGQLLDAFADVVSTKRPNNGVIISH
ncbi:PREDICTED: VIN3-like protein 1 isoform X3 [Camelina sativa]|uniref:VIN3-like protein 1 isoform X3 n=1 Tax=Camelina sativa TaxID=90675 RepID=A0ABM0XNJ1_CAMSA|nr:PREDICTED: VIN3-like protein 1 isoform X3 [Camelina sativa]